jgi:hypothetical protein
MVVTECPRHKRQPSLFEKKPHTPNKAPIIVRATLSDQPNYRLYAEALIALARQMQDHPAAKSRTHGAIASRSTDSRRTDPPDPAS